MLFTVLGSVQLTTEEKSFDLGPAKQRAILAALLVNLERPVSLESLVDRIWDETPPTDVRSVVYTYIARLRRKLSYAAHDCVTSSPSIKRVFSGYYLQTPPETVDLYQFRTLLQQSRQPDRPDTERSRLLSDANALWRGDPLSGMDGRWAAAMRYNLRQLRHEALVEWGEVEIRLGRPRAVLDPLRQALLDSPLTESLVSQLMLALHADGRSAEALQLFESSRRQLADEMGADPAPSLQNAYQDILNGRTTREDNHTCGHSHVQDFPSEVPTPRTNAVTSEEPAQSVNLLPIDLPDFTGREQEVTSLREALTPGDLPLSPSVAVLYGPAGNGKTTTAVHAAYRLRNHFPDGQLFVDLQGTATEPEHAHVVLDRFLRALGISAHDVPDSYVERAELYRARMAQSRVLVVLDHAIDEPQVAPLLPGTGHCAVIVTCHARPAVPSGVPVIHVGAFSHEESAMFLRRMIGDARPNSEPQAASELLDLCDGSPILLRILGGKLMTRQHWTISRLLDRLRDDNRLLDELADKSHDFSNRLDQVYRSLDHQAQRLFTRLATLPTHGFTVRSAARALRAGELETEEALEQMLERHMLTVERPLESGNRRYALPKLHRLYARTLSAYPIKNQA